MGKRPTSPKKSQAPRDTGILANNGDLFPDTLPPFAPRRPEPGTLPSEVLARLLTGERLTQVSFGFHGWRLAAYIKELDYLGWPIRRCSVPRPKSCGSGRPVKEYWLTPDTIQKARTLQQGGQA